MTKHWREVVNEALRDTKIAHRCRDSSLDEFLETFETFYDEKIATNHISAYPLDPPSSKRAAKNRAREVYADEFTE